MAEEGELINKRPWLWVGNLPDEAFLQEVQLLFWFVEGVREVWPLRIGRAGSVLYETTQGAWVLMESVEAAARAKRHLDSKKWFDMQLVTAVGELADEPYPFYFPHTQDITR